ncbi:MAG: hypothetical protein J0M09_05520 [Xanthomonadales bacterium]|nr:hypothetical protein [Xanthomonadales bacterium]
MKQQLRIHENRIFTALPEGKSSLDNRRVQDPPYESLARLRDHQLSNLVQTGYRFAANLWKTGVRVDIPRRVPKGNEDWDTDKHKHARPAARK